MGPINGRPWEEKGLYSAWARAKGRGWAER